MSVALEHRKSAGFIAIRKWQGCWQVLLLFHSSGNYWGFPKGHIEPGESKMQAAKRELFEETSLSLSRLIQEEPYEETFRFKGLDCEIEKHVFYFLAEVEGELIIDGQEILEGRFVDFDEAARLVTFDSAKKQLRQVREVLKDVS